MGVRDILDHSLYLFRRHLRTFCLIGLITYLPRIGIAFLGGMTDFQGTGPASRGDLFTVFSLLFLFLIFLFISQGSVVKVVSEIYLGHDARVRESYRYVLRSIGRYFWAFFLFLIRIALWIFFGSVAIVSVTAFVAMAKIGRWGGFPRALIYVGAIPAIALAVYGFVRAYFSFLLLPQTVLLEGARGSGAIKRCYSLYRQRGGASKIILVTVLMILLLFVIGFAVGMAAQFVLSQLNPRDLLWYLVRLSAEVINAVLMPLPLIATTLVYYDIRIRNEGFDLQVIAEALGYEEKPGVSASQGS